MPLINVKKAEPDDSLCIELRDFIEDNEHKHGDIDKLTRYWAARKFVSLGCNK